MSGGGPLVTLAPMSLPAEEVLTRRGGDRTLLGLALLAAGGLWLLDEAGVFDVTGRTMASAALVCIGAGLILKRRTSRRVWPIVVGGVLALSLLGNSASSSFRAKYGSNVGAHTLTPTSTADIHRIYRAGVGALTLDLTQVSFPDRWSKTVYVDVGLGAVRIVVPQNMQLRVSASDSIGAVTVVGHGLGSGFGIHGTYKDRDWTSDQTDPHLTLDLSVGGGAVTVDRAGS